MYTNAPSETWALNNEGMGYIVTTSITYTVKWEMIKGSRVALIGICRNVMCVIFVILRSNEKYLKAWELLSAYNNKRQLIQERVQYAQTLYITGIINAHATDELQEEELAILIVQMV